MAEEDGKLQQQGFMMFEKWGKRKLEHMYMQMIFLSHGSAVGLL